MYNYEDPDEQRAFLWRSYADDDVEHAERHGGIGAGANGQMNLCLIRKPDAPRIDGNDLRAAFHAIHDPMAVQTVGI